MVSWSRGGSHQQIGRVATSKHLRELLEVDLSVFPDVDEGKYILKLLVLGEIFAGLRVELFHHVIKLFESEVATPWVVPLSEGILG